MDNKNGRWITTEKGVHVFIYDGETEEQAINRTFNQPTMNDISKDIVKISGSNFSNRKNIVESFKKYLNIDLEKAITDNQFAPRTYLNFDSRKLNINEFNELKKYLKDKDVTMLENGAYDYAIRYKK